MAWEAKLTRDLEMDYDTGKLVAFVDFYDPAAPSQVLYSRAFRTEPGDSTPAQIRNNLRQQVQADGARAHSLYDSLQSLKTLMPVGATVPVT